MFSRRRSRAKPQGPRAPSSTASRARLREAGVEVLVLDDTPAPPKPDSAFPNNWVSFHPDGTLVLYPMAAPTRRLERRTEELVRLLEQQGLPSPPDRRPSQHMRTKAIFSKALEAWCSIGLRRTAYAALGPRTHRRAARRVCRAARLFDGRLRLPPTRRGRAIYHCNVLMSLGTRFALLCADVVAPSAARCADRRA